jgi:hypothetical protein
MVLVTPPNQLADAQRRLSELGLVTTLRSTPFPSLFISESEKLHENWGELKEQLKPGILVRLIMGIETIEHQLFENEALASNPFSDFVRERNLL